MDVIIYIQLSLLCTVNVFFTVVGVFLNTLVILCLLKSSQLQKKLCYFMLMVLSLFDLFAVVTNHPMLIIYSIVWMIEDYERLGTLYTYVDITDIFLGFSLLTLLVMNLDRYLAIVYPLFHRTSVTRRRLVVFLAIFLLFEVILAGISIDNLVISDGMATLIFATVVSPPLFFINYKLFIVARKISKRTAASSAGLRKPVCLKNISSCLLAVACLLCLYLPMSVYIALSIAEKSKLSPKVKISWLWTKTIIATNSTFNCLIFFWKNKMLRSEGLTVLKLLLGMCTKQ
ncbi:uncharacterized protein LOC114523312 [Dendronephthya gigantea]|uniref:uncharacterized protein LOC114523312 n=1 Tax=Dendronephthya gigantea TaxID=151771 RepID=UPI00106AA2B9|nr:uncharacterized protein LOC114523312 [Dendronephthya gigantea]